MSGEQKYLRFEDNKICLTFDMVRDNKSTVFLNELYRLYIKYNVVPSIIKDSNLDKNTFDKLKEMNQNFYNQQAKTPFLNSMI